MEKTIFAKKRSTKDGTRTFNSYFTKLVDTTTGEELTVQVKFREECGEPKNCPCNIIIDKKDVNLSIKDKTYTDEKTQEEKQTTERTLWVSAWKEGSPYVDHSMDNFE
jgi:hypothetical protein